MSLVITGITSFSSSVSYGLRHVQKAEPQLVKEGLRLLLGCLALLLLLLLLLLAAVLIRLLPELLLHPILLRRPLLIRLLLHRGGLRPVRRGRFVLRGRMRRCWSGSPPISSSATPSRR